MTYAAPPRRSSSTLSAVLGRGLRWLEGGRSTPAGGFAAAAAEREAGRDAYIRQNRPRPGRRSDRGT